MWSGDDSLIKELRFQLPLLYRKQSKSFLAANSVSAYISFAASLLLRERTRLTALLPPETASPLLSLLEGELIGGHAPGLEAEFNGLLQAGDTGKLSLLYGLLEVNPGAMTALTASFESMILSDGASDG